MNAEVTVINRDEKKAEALAVEFGCSHYGLGYAGDAEGYFLAVQTTSVGMHPFEGADSVPDFRFKGTEIAYDLIYAPEKTLFLERAEASGCRIINGLPMLEAQARIQFRLFTGKDAHSAT